MTTQNPFKYFKTSPKIIRLAIMYHGKIVETGDTETIISKPVHDYTKKLLAANLETKY